MDVAPLRDFVASITGLAQSGSDRPRILHAGCHSDGEALTLFRKLDWEAEGFDSSEDNARNASEKSGARTWVAHPLLVNLSKEFYLGIWAPRSFAELDPTACQRLLATFFRALKPRGILFAAFETKESLFPEPRHESISSLLRQNGFQVLREGADLQAQGRLGFLCRRI